ncbi:uncharacterized protein BKCO1_18000148 [Diplodia corticola]|uniref:Uncharacterized protein n=1 Tax=Diplodia corticola TaxID=236234 RepID=A0A1J9R3S9_9PEZI|nr:uncharacterized protein BKCO1_18000148 [Diplodia corticola]OJD35233.1 hypothetical protein BKCO1_18000148 [Diplodia corticola]
MELTAVRIRGKRKARSDPPPDAPTAKKRRPGRPRTRPLSPVRAWKPKYVKLQQQWHPDREILPPGKEIPARPVTKWDLPLPWPEHFQASASQSQTQTQTETQLSTLPDGTQTPLIKKKKRRSSYWRKLSPLERLPAEVLQQIFLESMNMSLPIASIELLHKLNSDHIKLEFSLRALYWPDDEERTESADLPEMQGKLLSLRFFDWDFYKQYAAKACEKFGAWPWLQEQEPEATLEELVRRDSDFDVLDRFNLGCELAEEIPPFLKLHEKTPLPAKLLKGPWDYEKHLMLRFLFIQNLGIDHDSSTSSETLIEGLMGVARDKESENVEIAKWLICIAIASDTQIPQSLLRRAVIDGGCNEDLVESMLTWSLRSEIEYFDPMLWNWAERARDKKKGRWLMDQLRAAASNKEELVAEAQAAADAEE